MFPVLLDLKDRLCVVVGGGPVGLRKARGLLAAGARVRLVCLEPPRTLEGDGLLEWRQEPYGAAHLHGAALVFAAATAAVNAQVAADARARKILVNLADDPRASDFFVPATLRRGELLIAISTGGASPALARRVRQRLEEDFDTAFGDWVALLAELRPVILLLQDEPCRRKLFARLTDWAWLERIRKEGLEAVRQAMRHEVNRQREA